jgi:tryptophan synthase beta chain
MNYGVNEEGYYGDFGGSYIPEMLYANVEELRMQYLDILGSETFQKDFRQLLRDYAGRPSPLFLAKRLSEETGTQVWLKREDLLHTGAHKINNTVGQILMARHLGKNRIIAETGAGQHGVATATVCALAGMECIVYMGDTDIRRQQPNVKKMKMLGAKVIAVHSGNKTLKDATNEAIRDWINHPRDTHYIIGSVVGPHPYPDLVSRLQSVISEELLMQIPGQTGKERPDAIIACVGGGSNAIGAFYHYLDMEKVRLVGVEASGKGVNTSETAATLEVGRPGIIHGSQTMLMQDEDGQILEPYSISAGLDYPGVGPVHAFLHKKGRVEYLSVTDQEALDAAFVLAKLEGIIPALETAHALAALWRLDFRKEEVVIVNLSGRGDKDMEAYTKMMDDEQD